MERNINCLIYAPVRSYSLFGDKSREFIKALKEMNLGWDISVRSYNIPNTRCDFFHPDIEELISKELENINVCISFGYPDVFMKAGDVNVGITCTHDFRNIPRFINCCNQMDYIGVFSNHDMINLKSMNYDINSTKVTITPPIFTIPEYIDESKLSKVDTNLLSKVPETWNFFCQAQWNVIDESDFGGLNTDNVRFVLQNFLSVFADIDNAPGLILNVNCGMPSILDKTKLMKKLNDIKEDTKHYKSIPNVYFINDYIDDNTKLSLFSDDKIKAFIDIPQRSESVQNDLMYMYVEKPVINSGFGAQKDTLNYLGNLAVGGNQKVLQEPDMNATGPYIIDSFRNDLQLGMFNAFYHYDSLMNDLKISNPKSRINNKEYYLNTLKPILESLTK